MSGFGQDYRDEIRNMAGLLAEGREEEALSGLDNLNWRKIHNISAIVQASELYEACGRLYVQGMRGSKLKGNGDCDE